MTDNSIYEEAAATRKAHYEISPLILNRWSPRAMTGESLTDDELYPLFEAARWAPSSYNGQPWRFIIARREDTENFKRHLDLLVEGNQAWAKDAAVLAIICSRKNFEHNDKPSVTHTFDTGSAWENLALEGSSRGLVVHGMEGFDYEKAQKELNIPEDFEVHAMIAVGKKTAKESLPEDVQEKETPNDRRPLHEIVFDGEFGKELDALKKLA